MQTAHIPIYVCGDVYDDVCGDLYDDCGLPDWLLRCRPIVGELAPPMGRITRKLAREVEDA